MPRVLSAFTLVMAVALATPAMGARPGKGNARAPKSSSRQQAVQRAKSKRGPLAAIRRFFTPKTRSLSSRAGGIPFGKFGASIRVDFGAGVSVRNRAGGLLGRSELSLAGDEPLSLGRQGSMDKTFVFEAVDPAVRDNTGRILGTISRRHVTLSSRADGSVTVLNGASNEQGGLYVPVNGTKIDTRPKGVASKSKNFRKMAEGEEHVIEPGGSVWLQLAVGSIVRVDAPQITSSNTTSASN